MRTLPVLLVTLSLSCKNEPPEAATPAPATEADLFVQQTNARLLELWKQAESAQWVHQTDITDEHAVQAAAAEEQTMAFLSEAIASSTRWDGASLSPETTRMLKLLKTSSPLPAPDDPALRSELAAITTELSSIYGKGKWCPPAKAGEEAEPDCLDIGEISEQLAHSRDPAEQLALWEGWHAISPPMREQYQRFVELGNQGATEIGFADLGELWRSGYDMSPAELETETDRLWEQLRPLYTALHCEVRAELSETYGPQIVPPTGPIPAHLLGNLWAQDWSAVYPLVEPYPDQPSLDVDRALEEQAWDPKKMTQTAEAFFTSLGLDPLPATFWERSMFVKPEDREVVCHASAWDPSWSDDLRIKMCIEPTKEDLVTLHHELGHLYYYHYYKGQPALFRAGANDGFHEAIGDTVALSITPGYLQRIGLLSEASEAPEAVVNAQMQVALERLAFLPFGLVVDRWRWEVFDGRITPEGHRLAPPEGVSPDLAYDSTASEGYNAGWWRLRTEIQGIAPPSPRGEELFDAGAKYHVPANTPYLRYFLAHVLEFQLHRALCKEAGFTGPLHACSVYGSKEAGEKLKALLAAGASRPWPEVLEEATGQREMDATAIVEYFQPLMTWLDQQNQGRTCGW